MRGGTPFSAALSSAGEGARSTLSECVGSSAGAVESAEVAPQVSLDVKILDQGAVVVAAETVACMEPKSRIDAMPMKFSLQVLWLCQSMFDMHRIPYHARIGRAQFQEWVVSNPLPHSFVQAFHEPYSLSDVTANVQRRAQRHGAIFNELNVTGDGADGQIW